MNERREKGREGGRKEGWKEKRFCKRRKDKRQLAPGLRGRKWGRGEDCVNSELTPVLKETLPVNGFQGQLLGHGFHSCHFLRKSKKVWLVVGELSRFLNVDSSKELIHSIQAKPKTSAGGRQPGRSQFAASTLHGLLEGERPQSTGPDRSRLLTPWASSPAWQTPYTDFTSSVCFCLTDRFNIFPWLLLSWRVVPLSRTLD